MNAAASPGTNTIAEILSQPECWNSCLENLQVQQVLPKLLEQFPQRKEWLFVGCGSSYYIALAAAAAWTELTGTRARAVPPSELLLFPETVPIEPRDCQPVLISRSGFTSEVLRAAEYFESGRKIPTIAITCARQSALERIAAFTISLSAADEKSTVMTRSFTSMLLALEWMAAAYAGRKEFQTALGRLSQKVKLWLPALSSRMQEFVSAREFRDYVYLAQGPFVGLAWESALKVTEMSCSYAQSYHTLEFRHGPKSIVGPETLLTFFLSDSGLEAERSVLEEMKDLKGTTLAVVEKADSETARSADLLVELRTAEPQLARLPAAVIPGQLLGFYTGIKKGYDPDLPRHLTRVVELSSPSVLGRSS